MVLATSGRAIAQGITSLGCTVAVVDGFGDCDTHAAATEALKIERSYFGLDHDSVLRSVQDLQTRMSFDGVLFDAAIESDPQLLDAINIFPILGNSRHVIETVKNAEIFFSTLDQYSIPYPETKLHLSPQEYSSDMWLVKHAQGTGGVGVTATNTDVDITKNVYFQKKLNGKSFSITLLANGDDLFALGFNTLWSESLGQSVPYAYAGAINQVKLADNILETALSYAKVLVKEFKLVGLNSIDFIYAEHSMYVLEINPRIPATYELYETKHGELMERHIQACVHQQLPEVISKPLLRAHAVVYAPKDITIPADVSWPLWTADRPQALELIKKLDPLCSIFAGGKNYSQVNDSIKTRKRTILSKF